MNAEPEKQPERQPEKQPEKQPEARPPRRRVTATASARPASVRPASARPEPSTGRPTATATGANAPGDAPYLGALVRAQLRLGLACGLGFVAAGVLLAVTIAVLPADLVLAGVPLPWLLQAYAFYPLMLGFAIVYVVAAARNERRYRMLESRS